MESKEKNMLAIAIAMTAIGFQNITDKGGYPYILHCIRVMQSGRNEDEKILGIAHDLIEDFIYTVEDLQRAGFSEKIINQLLLLTHNRDVDTYEEYIRKIALSGDLEVIWTKRNDLRDNSDITRIKGLIHKDFVRIEKYHKAYTYLSEI